MNRGAAPRRERDLTRGAGRFTAFARDATVAWRAKARDDARRNMMHGCRVRERAFARG